MYRLLPLVLVVLLSACSTRVEYPHASTPSSPDAIDINTATADELEKLPHIGRKTAESIVQFRSENGPFRRVEHILLIRGISESRFAELRPMLRIGDE
jgi:competence ComEA-like helix-hairpin-helix protein